MLKRIVAAESIIPNGRVRACSRYAMETRTYRLRWVSEATGSIKGPGHSGGRSASTLFLRAD